MAFERYRDIIPEFDLFQQAVHRPQPNQVRINTLRAAPEDFVRRMTERYGVTVRRGPFGPDAVEMDGLPNPGATIEYFRGEFHMQGFSSMLPPLALSLEPGNAVLDLCAAPGSKATQVAALLNNDGFIVANDARRDRLKVLKFQIERLGVLCGMVTSYPAQAFPLYDRPPERQRGDRQPPEGERVPLGFDRILADVPCTGEGSCRPTAENRRNRQPIDFSRFDDERAIARYEKLQHQILRRAWDLLRPGGILVYSTCTFAPEENEAVVDALLSETEGIAEPIGVDGPWEPGIPEWMGKAFHPGLRHAVRVYPHRFDSWGFFLARIRKPMAA